MRNTRSCDMRNQLLASSDTGKLSDAQAMYYMRRMWSVLPEKVRSRCVYVDPKWIYKFIKHEDQQETVVRWFNRLSIFTKKYVFLPICLSNHWSLLILCNPGGDLKVKKERPSMILLDSLDCLLKKDVEELMTRLLWKLFKDRVKSKLEINKIKMSTPKLPKQDDDKSCGFFVLYFMTLFLKSFPESFCSTIGYPSFLSSNWFVADSLDSFHKSLTTIFERIDDYTEPIQYPSSSVASEKNRDTINLIRSCLKGLDDTKIESCMLNQKKRKIEDAVEVIEMKSIPADNTRKRNSIQINEKLIMKLKPTLFNEVLDNLSESQTEWITKTGFGFLLSFKMTRYPVTLGYNLVNCFDEKTCCLLIDGVRLPITDVDVEEILGLPRGYNDVRFELVTDQNKAWRRQYKENDNNAHFRVPLRSIADKIICSEKVDLDFKMNFLCLLVTMLIHHPNNSFVRQYILSFSGDIDKCSNYNWCAFLRDKLKSAKKIWMRDPKKQFYTGSLPLLVFFFLDRALTTKYSGTSKLPKYSNWLGFSLRNVELSLMQSNVLVNGVLKQFQVPEEIFNSWKNEVPELLNKISKNESDDQADEVEKVSTDHYRSHQVPEVLHNSSKNETDDKTDGFKKFSTDHYRSNQITVDELKKTLVDFEAIRDNLVKKLYSSSKDYMENEEVIALKDKFVDLNNTANWIVETSFDNPLAFIYETRQRMAYKQRRLKTDQEAGYLKK